MEDRSIFFKTPEKTPMPITEEGGSHYISCAMPIIAEGDIIGCVLSGWSYETDTGEKISEAVEAKLLQTAGIFLGKQMEE